MAAPLRLRQICLVAPHLEPVVGDIATIMGLKVCYRDGNVAKYGLENALLPIDATLLEVVAPVRAGTAAGRFLEKTGGRGGYMAIFSCDDPDERGRNAEQLGVRIANVIDHPPYHGVQLHPRDCRAAFIEFNHTEGSDGVFGPYPPAGPDWQESVCKEMTSALPEVEMQSADPCELARHWSRIIGVAANGAGDGEAEIVLVNCTLRFVRGDGDAMTALTFQVADVAAVRDAARSRGYAVASDRFRLGGVEFRLAHVPAKWNPARRQEHAQTVESTRFPFTWDHRVIPCERKTL